MSAPGKRARARRWSAGYLGVLLLWVALSFFLWMFLASEGLEQTATAGRFGGANVSNLAAVAERYSYEWRHGMVGDWPLYVPGFFAVTIAVVLWSRGRAIRHLVAWGALALALALLSAKLLAPLGTWWLILSFERDADLVLQGSARGATWTTALPGMLTVVSWATLIVAVQVSAARRSIWPLLLPLGCYGALAMLRPGALGDLVRPWAQALWRGNGVAIVSTVMIPLVVVALWRHSRPGAEPNRPRGEDRLVRIM